jgi:uncharacterized protein YciI
MTVFALHYTYDERAAAREATRPEHRAYWFALADAGRVLALSRYDDDLEPGALLILDVEGVDAAEALVAADPYVRAGLVPSHSVRAWPAAGPLFA